MSEAQMRLSAKSLIIGGGIGIVLVLVLLEAWGAYLDRSNYEAAQPKVIVPLTPARLQRTTEVYKNFPRPWFPQTLSSDATSWNLTPLQGARTTLREFKGRVVVLNFWNTSCISCIEEMPGIKKLNESLHDPRIVFAAVTNEPRPVVDKFLGATKVEFPPVYLYEEEPPAPVAVPGVPTTYIVAADGRLVFTHSGGLNWDDDGARAYLLNLAAGTAN
jgi:thiol-disulfide isomerase/thioredoxin